MRELLQRSTAARAVLAGAALAVLVIVFLVARRLPSTSAPAQAALPSPPAAASTPLPVGSPTATPTASPSPPGLVVQPQITPNLPRDSAAAEKTAGAFATAYATYRYDDAPDALENRLQPYITPTLLRELSQGGGAGSVETQREALHEVATATVMQVADLGLNGDRLVIVVKVNQTVKNDQGTQSSPQLEELYLAETPDGWRVDEVST